MEKQQIPLANEQPAGEANPRRTKKHYLTHFILPAFLVLNIFRFAFYGAHPFFTPHPSASTPQCDQPAPLNPRSDSGPLDAMLAHMRSEPFTNASIARLSGAVQIRTESFDDLGPIGEDKRWEVMYPFAEYLATTFPRVHAELSPEKVNTHGLVYTYAGSEAELKPLVLMAHQDVVPVPDATVGAWTHPPFSGFFDGKYIWGRGSTDCKNNLIAIMEAMELLLEAGYTPKRTVVLSFGFDEEVSGPQGAGYLAPFLLERYGKDGVAAIVDEGAGFTQAWGSVFATPGTAEKGYTDVEITVRMNGGHSSIPSDHTSIGVLSEIISKIEAEQYPIYLSDDNPFLHQLECGTENAPDFPSKLKKQLSKRANTCPRHDPLALEAAKLGKSTQYLMQTSQAADVISGGVKTNALPERATATINHRINVAEMPATVYNHLTALVKPIAKKYSLDLNAFTEDPEAPLSIVLKPLKSTDPAPVTPTELNEGRSPYSILAATTRALYGEDIVISPSMMTGNTDTRYYWDLTRHIFRFGPGWDPEGDEGLGNIHTVNERVSVKAHVGMVRWFAMFVRNMDEADLQV